MIRKTPSRLEAGQQQISKNSSAKLTPTNAQLLHKNKMTSGYNSVQHSLNSSGGLTKTQHERRQLLVGRTPSPNYIKRIAGLMNFMPQGGAPGHDSQYLTGVAQMNNSKNYQKFSQNKRHISKQQHSSNTSQKSTKLAISANNSGYLVNTGNVDQLYKK
jgi:hypothetical protein